MSRILQFASHLLQDSKSFQILLASEKLKDSQHSQDIFFQSTQHWIKRLPGWLILGILKNLSAATSHKYQLFCNNYLKHRAFPHIQQGPMLWVEVLGPRSSWPGREVRSLPCTYSNPSTHVLGKIRLLLSKQHRQHPLKLLLQTPF